MKLYSAILTLLLCLSGCRTPSVSATPPEPKETIISFIQKVPQNFQRIIYGDPDPYPFVGSINFADDERLIGSGVVIDPLVVLTAAHVSDNFNAEDLVFITQDGDRHCVAEVVYYPVPKPRYWIFNPCWSEHYDVAMLILEDECDEIPVELFNPEQDRVYKGSPLTVIGYSGGIKRYSKDDVFWYFGRLISKPQFEICLPITDTVWFGDSGGALITENGKLIGITSYLAHKNGVYYENGFSSIQFYYSWINTITQE